MRAVTLYGARDVRVGDVPLPTIREDGDAIIKLAAACVCGSDLWAYAVSTRSPSRSPWAMSTAV